MTTGRDAGGTPDLVSVQVVDLPVALHVRARQHVEELQREFRLLTEYLREEPVPQVPGRLLQLVRALSSSYGGFTIEQEDLLEAAVAQGRASLTMVFRVPRGAGDAARTLGAMLDEADDFCRAGKHLLTLATPPELVAYRRWYLDQFVTQTAGGAAVPWGSR